MTVDSAKEHLIEIIISLILLGFGIHVVHLSIQMKYFGEDVTSPGLFPSVIGVFISVLAIIEIYKSFKKITGSPTARGAILNDLSVIEEVKLRFKTPDLYRTLSIIILFFLYILLVQTYDFILCTIVFLFIAFMFLGNVTWWKAVLISIITPLSIQYIFSTIFRVGMP